MKRAMQAVLSCFLVSAVAGATLGCGEDAPPVDAAIIPDAPPEIGTLSLTWALTNGGTPLQCSDVGGLNVSVTATPQDGGFSEPSSFSCDSGTGMSLPFNSGIYNIEVTLVASGNQQLADPQTLQSIEILTGENTDLGSFTFDVAPMGNVDFTITTEAVAGNCTSEAQNGAGITEIAIEFLDGQGTCVPSTFTIGDGANQTGGTYNADCQGARYTCIDADQAIRAENVPSGTKSMTITGYRGVDECYTRMPQFTVPGNGLSTELLPQTLTPVGACASP